MSRGNLFAWPLPGIGAMSLSMFALLGVNGQKPEAPVLNGWRLAEPVLYENLSVFPVVSRQAADTSGFVTLDEALASGEAVVTERGGEILRRTRDARPVLLPQTGGAQVNQLVLIYRGSKPLVLLAGELLSGGKQDRVVAKDRIVPPGAEPLPLDVFCVEHGRWSAGSQFSTAKMMAHPSVREKAAVDKEQSQVWSAVRSGTTSRQAAGLAGGAPAAQPAVSAEAIGRVIADEARSESYLKVYKSPRIGQSVEAFAEEVQRRFTRATAQLKDGRVVGVVVAYGGEIAWSDVFASPALFDRYWPKLLRSYVVEALARPQTHEHASVDDAREFLKPLQGRETLESEPSVYRWRQVTQGRYAEIALEALRPASVTLHWLKIHRTS